MLSMPRLFAAACLAAAAAHAQDGRDPVPEVDPYTKGDPKIMQAAGYVNFGPFRFGDDHTTFQVEQVLGGVPLVWAETAHFRIGLSLDTYDMPADREERKALEAELARLRKKFPKMKRKVRELDTWLRLHLYAQRLEDFYASFCEHFDLDETSFPAEAEGDKGPYLGMPGKFSILITQKRSSFGRYTSTYLGQNAQAPYRFWHNKTGIVFYGTAMDFLGGGYENDVALHCSLISGLTKNFVNAAFGYDTDTPFFWREGVAHWFVRQVHKDYPFFTATTDKLARVRVDEEWEPKVRARVGHEAYPPSADMIRWDDPDALELADHLILWSRIDYLMSQERDAPGELLRRFKKTAQDPRTVLIEAGAADPFVKDFSEALGMSPAEFDEAWARWVKKNYSKR